MPNHAFEGDPESVSFGSRKPLDEEFGVGKPGIVIDIPEFGRRVIRTVVSDYTGTLSRRGKLSPGVRARLGRLLRLVDLEIITADSYGTAGSQLKGIAVPHMLQRKRHAPRRRSRKASG